MFVWKLSAQNLFCEYRRNLLVPDKFSSLVYAGSCDPKQRGGKAVSAKEFTCIVSVAVVEEKLKSL